MFCLYPLFSAQAKNLNVDNFLPDLHNHFKILSKIFRTLYQNFYFISSGELDVVVKRVESTHICSGSQDAMPAYKMTAYPRGLALIIEIEEFVNNVEKPRIGSHVSFL
jgi:hypothetical protein